MTDSRYRTRFGATPRVFVVIHAEDAGQAERNAAIAHDAGADGVFLINHAISSDALRPIVAQARARWPAWFIGANCLDRTPAESIALLGSLVDAVWSDDALVDERVAAQPEAAAIVAAQRRHAPDALHFGGVAFKYRRAVDDLAAACRAAVPYVDVVTTSGPGTGMAADVAKIRAMRAALGRAPLAIASGITPENAGDYLPYTDAFLVATGVSVSFTELDAAKVTRLVERVRAG
jgi:predicted TIM-barrel enzyme